MTDDSENFIILLVGASDRAIPTAEHLQKEMFLLCEAVPKTKNLFRFEKHYEGPFCQSLQEEAKDPFYHADAYGFDAKGQFHLTAEGRKEFSTLAQKYGSQGGFSKILDSMKLIRGIYDRLTKEELLLLIYITYPKFTELSNIYDSLVRDASKRKGLADGLLAKGVITDDRHKEIVDLRV